MKIHCKFSLSIKSLKLLYNAFILPNLSYCITIWGNTYKSNINRFIILQNRAIRAIYNLQNRINTNEFYKNYKFCFPVKFIINIHS